MDEQKTLKEAEKNIKLPEKAQDNSGWIVKYKENNIWKKESFKLQEDAWNFFYSKLSELKTTLMKTQLVRQKGA